MWRALFEHGAVVEASAQRRSVSVPSAAPELVVEAILSQGRELRAHSASTTREMPARLRILIRNLDEDAE
jgi:hypothetical protein